ncbi:MAG: glycosyltransferase family 2 protein [Patescibacteria group bacterium]
MNISAIIIAKNEEARILKCLSSLKWADEMIVVDNGSMDKTTELALRSGAVIVKAQGVVDFAKLRNIAKDKALSGWLLYVDADEVVTEELAKEIRKVIRDQLSSFSGYKIRRKNYYLGHEWPADEYILRLMRKDALTEWYGELHETARITGEIGRLHAPLLHDTHRSLGEMVTKTNEWSQAEARLRFDAEHPPVVWWRFIRVMSTAFFDSFIGQGGWRAGTLGWIESIYQAFSIFITYAKLWEMQQSNKLTK